MGVAGQKAQPKKDFKRKVGIAEKYQRVGVAQRAQPKKGHSRKTKKTKSNTHNNGHSRNKAYPKNDLSTKGKWATT